MFNLTNLYTIKVYKIMLKYGLDSCNHTVADSTYSNHSTGEYYHTFLITFCIININWVFLLFIYFLHFLKIFIINGNCKNYELNKIKN